MNPCFNFFKKHDVNDVEPTPIQSPTPTTSPILTPTASVPNVWNDLKPLNTGKIHWYTFPDNKFFKEEYNKTQIVLHHTVSGPDIDGDVTTWIENKYNVATTIIVDRDGIPWQLFSSKYWAYHLGVATNNHSLDKHSIGIEIDNWGGLTRGNGLLKTFHAKKSKLSDWFLKGTDPNKYYTYYGNAVDVPMQYYPDGFRGYNYYEKYTEAQIRTVGELLLLWKNKYGIPLQFHENMFDYSQDAMNGVTGVWTHVSFRLDKSDCHPQPELIEMLKTIQNL